MITKDLLGFIKYLYIVVLILLARNAPVSVLSILINSVEVNV